MHDWSPVGTDGDLPGDPGDLRRCADRLDDLATDWNSLQSKLAGMLPQLVWAGLAVQTFERARDEVTRVAKALAKSADEAGAALRNWGTQLDAFHADGLTARNAARIADDDIDAARRGLASRQAFDREQKAVMAEGDDPRRWWGPDWDAELADARGRRTQAQQNFDNVVTDHDRAASAVADDIAAAKAMLVVATFQLGDWFGWGGGGAGLPLQDGIEFVRTPRGLVLNTAASWRHEAYLAAGVDPDTYDPSLGLEGMEGDAAKLWEFYGQLYEDNPDEFLWAGMANLAGIQIHAGIEDLVMLRKLVETGTMTPVEAMEALVGRQLPEGMEQVAELVVSGPFWAMKDIKADEFVNELRWTETKLLFMQKAIFEDLGWQHLAYDNGGIAALQAIARHDPDHVRQVHLDAWGLVQTGDPETALQRFADYEQNTILQPYYNQILDRKPVPRALTWGMTITARSPTPSGGYFWEETWQAATLHTPDEVTVPEFLPGPQITINTPDELTLYGVPGEMPPNIAYADDRWEWVRDHMTEQFLDDLDNGTAQEWIESDLRNEAQQRRLIPDVPIIGVDD